MRIRGFLVAVSFALLGCGLFLPTQPGATTAPIQPPTAVASVGASQSEPTSQPSPSEAPSPVPTQVPFANELPDSARAQWRPLAGGFNQPLDIQSSGDGRLFVVEQPGVIRVLVDGTTLPQPFLDIRGRVESGGNEQGLLGLAFPPDFDQSGVFYVNYTGGGGQTRLSSFQLGSDPNVADPASETVLLRLDQPFRNHNGGGLAFGPDGMLFVSTGDGGSAGDPLGSGQRLDTLLGKLLRLDVSQGAPYSIPSDNPFLGRADALDEIWAYGLRNPWRFSFDRASGDLYIADVGQNQWEEINFEPRGSGGNNYGWNAYEGTHVYAGAIQGTVFPVAEYSHGQGGCSVTGGVVARDPALPEWQGVYLYGDYCSGIVWGLLKSDEGDWSNELLFRTQFSITSFGSGANGEVYLADRAGSIYQLLPAE